VNHIPKLFFVSLIAWIACALVTRLTGSQSEFLLQTVRWSFALAAGIAVIGTFFYTLRVDLHRIYATGKFGLPISRNDIFIFVASIAFMFIGLPLTFSVMKNDTEFSRLLLLSMGLFMLIPALLLARLLWHASKTGRMFYKGGYADRNVSPRWFWGYVIFGVFGFLMFAAMGAVVLISVVSS
jgi:hypothetical protein